MNTTPGLAPGVVLSGLENSVVRLVKSRELSYTPSLPSAKRDILVIQGTGLPVRRATQAVVSSFGNAIGSVRSA